MDNQSRAIWWIKRDMRLSDNEALTAALAQHDSVIALFICEPSIYHAPDTSPMHVFAWWQALTSLQTHIQLLGGQLYFAKGEVVDVLEHLSKTTPFEAIYSHEETGSNTSYQRDIAVSNWCGRNDISWVEHAQSGVIRGLKDRDLRNEIIEKRHFHTPLLPAPTRVHSWNIIEDDIISTTWPDYSSLCDLKIDSRIQFKNMQQVNELCASQELKHFLEQRVDGYSKGISSPNSAFQTGSRLSVHLAWGTISVRTVFHESNKAIEYWRSTNSNQGKHWARNIQAFQSRLHWRDHFTQRLESASHMEHQALNPAFEQMAYEDEPQLLQAWINGKTGIPLVDACMRCLVSTGFMNFRMRAMLVTTACFGLRLSWRTVQYPLARVFYDYEPGIHYSQMQMQAGIVGINTMRVYNPQKQLLDQDPHCIFIKRWIPELQEFSADDICNYNQLDLGDYPSPADDIATNSAYIKDQISQIKKSEEAITPTANVLAKHGSRLRSRRKSKAKQSQLASDQQMALPLNSEN